MTQLHRFQYGIFLVTTNAHDREPWCVSREIPEIIIGNLLLTKRIQRAKVYAFCILPDHMHIIVRPGERGLSKFVQSFKMNSSREIRLFRRGKLNIPNLEFFSGDSGISAEKPFMETEIPIKEQVCVYGGLFHGWQHGFHAQCIGNAEQMKKTTRYVERNAHRHKLVYIAKDWPWTSLHFGYVIDKFMASRGHFSPSSATTGKLP